MTTQYPLWILICDACRARVLSVESSGQAMLQLHELEHPESRAKNQDLVSDRPGRMQQSAGLGGRSAMEPQTSATQVEHERFARQLAELLELARSRNTYKQLVIVAEPSFLGLLRQCLDEQVKKTLATTLSKDYTAVPLHKLPEYLTDVLPA